MDHLYGLLFTFGLALVIEGMFRHDYGLAGKDYPLPASLTGGYNLGFMFLPEYRAWSILASLVICLVTWYGIERTRLGAYLRAATENPTLVRAFGINVPLLLTLTYAFCVGLGRPRRRSGCTPLSGQPANGVQPHDRRLRRGGHRRHGVHRRRHRDRPRLGVIEGLTKVFFIRVHDSGVHHHGARAARAAGRTVRQGKIRHGQFRSRQKAPARSTASLKVALLVLLIAAALVAPSFVYPLFLVKILCFVLFASALNLVLGYAGLLSFGHAAFFGGAAYIAAHSAKVWGFPFEFAINPLRRHILDRSRLSLRRAGNPTAWHLFRHDNAGAAQMVYFLAVQMPFTGGEDGIQAVPRGSLLGLVDLGNTTSMYYVVLGFTAFGLLVIWRTVRSPFGHVLAAIRENEQRATSLGLNVERYKLIAFTLSAALSGLAGSLKAIAFLNSPRSRTSPGTCRVRSSS